MFTFLGGRVSSEPLLSVSDLEAEIESHQADTKGFSKGFGALERTMVKDPSSEAQSSEPSRSVVSSGSGGTVLELQMLELLVQIRSELRDKHRISPEVYVEQVGIPSWLSVAAQSATACDLPNAARRPSGVRVLPSLQRQIEVVQKRRGMRSSVGTWEWLLKLGLAVEGRLPLPDVL